MFNSPCLITLPFLIVFFADNCVNSHGKTFSVRWGLVSERRWWWWRWWSRYDFFFSEVVFVWLVARCQIWITVSGAQCCVVLVAHHLKCKSKLIVFAQRIRFCQSWREPFQRDGTSKNNAHNNKPNICPEKLYWGKKNLFWKKKSVYV